MELSIKRIHENRIIINAYGETSEVMDLAAYAGAWSKCTFLPEKERISFEFSESGLEMSFPESNEGLERVGNILENAISGWDRISLTKLYKRYKIEKKAFQEKVKKEAAEKKRLKSEKEEKIALAEIEKLNLEFKKKQKDEEK